MTSRGYNITIERLSEKLGGGFVGHAPALMAWPMATARPKRSPILEMRLTAG